MNQITVMGMVLMTTPVGEYDKRVVILTRERGKIAAFARGARRPNSPLAGTVMPFSFGEFTIYEGRTSYTMVSASVSNYFAELRGDMEAACYGCYFIDIANYYAREENDETQLLKLLYQTLRALTKPSIPNRLIRCVYELKAVCVNGEGPQVFRCVACGSCEHGSVFSAQRGGLLCEKCRRGAADEIHLCESSLYALQFIVSSPVEKLYTFNVSEEVLRELEDVAASYMKTYVGKSFRSLEILEQMITPV